MEGKYQGKGRRVRISAIESEIPHRRRITIGQIGYVLESWIGCVRLQHATVLRTIDPLTCGSERNQFFQKFNLLMSTRYADVDFLESSDVYFNCYWICFSEDY